MLRRSDAPAPRRRRRRLAPEIIQTSAMDCGPAALASLLQGHGVPASYPRLRELCQTGLDGTSIDTIEEVARRLGLDAEQIMVPPDYLFEPESRCLPALVVVRQPGGGAHFVVAWNATLDWVQVMDPAFGRHWETAQRFLGRVLVHEHRVAAEDFRAWTETADFTSLLRARLSRLGLTDATVRSLADQALAGPGWRSPAAMDAAVRAAGRLVRARALGRGEHVGRLIRAMHARALAADGPDDASATGALWMARLDGAPSQIVLRGVVLVRVRGVAPPAASAATGAGPGASPGLVPRSDVVESGSSPGRVLVALILRSGGRRLAILATGAVLVACGGLMEVLVLRGLLSHAPGFGTRPAAAILELALLSAGLLAIEVPLEHWARRVARGVELRLRMSFLERLPRIFERYLASLPSSDLAERCHSLHGLRLVPLYALVLLRTLMEALFVAIAVIWLEPRAWPYLVAMAAAAVIIPLATSPVLSERDMRVRTHAGGLGRFDLDALLAIVPIRVHGGEAAMRQVHQTLLVQWARAQLDRGRVAVLAGGLQLAVVSALAAALIGRLASAGALQAGFLLTMYWLMRLPTLTERATALVQDYPTRRNAALRAMELLRAPAHPPIDSRPPAGPRAAGRREAGIALHARHVVVRIAGRVVLDDINFGIPAGAHVAIVGPSGSGKTTLLGVLLGWHAVESGEVLADGRTLGPGEAAVLRERTAWVDSAVRIWNRSLLENVRYGSPEAEVDAIVGALDGAELGDVGRSLPRGMRSALGEAGGRLSGGEGQRVRLARAWLRPAAGLVLLDEAFRGLEPDRRSRLTGAARRHWRAATMLFVTHDLVDALDFDRVLVLEDGRILEDGAPRTLARDPASRLASLLAVETAVAQRLERDGWGSVTLDDGRIRSTSVAHGPSLRTAGHGGRGGPDR